MIRTILDYAVATIGILACFVPMILIALVIKGTSKGPIFHLSKRIGANSASFTMPKFRTMRINTPEVATHKLDNPGQYLTPVGGFLRKSSLDELPQLFCVLQNKMSLVGPRPALFNQYDLIESRQELGLDKFKPGVTGLAQVNGRDELSIEEKIKYEITYMEQQSLQLDLYILLKTVQKLVTRAGVSH